jgi:cytochrome bd ubiquinol oxidase subunit II
MTSLSNFDFSVAFAVAEAFIIALYVVLDGFDLGVGILFPFAPRPADRDLMIETLAPVWDGNETWLVLGGMVLLTAFPGAFAILLPAYYVPLALMLFALILRGISFEFRAQGGPLQFAWTVAFAGGSALAAFCQGAILGSFVGGGFQVVGGRFAGGPFDWLNLFSIITGFGVIAGYGLLGACWLIWKTKDDTQIFARELAFTTLLSTGAAIVVVSLWTPLSVPQIAERWFALGASRLAAVLVRDPAFSRLPWRAWRQHMAGGGSRCHDHLGSIVSAPDASRSLRSLARDRADSPGLHCLQLLDVQRQNACAGSEHVRDRICGLRQLSFLPKSGAADRFGKVPVLSPKKRQ